MPAAPRSVKADLDMKPLSARSAVLSLVLGAHPEGVSPAKLAAAGTYFAIPGSTLRAALARAVQNGDLLRDGRDYVLGEKLLRRRHHQIEAITPGEVPWTGEWEVAIVVVTGRAGGDRAALREMLTAHRLAERREGVWMRPANLRRAAEYRSHPVLNTLRARPDQDPAELAAELWNLDAWSDHGRALVSQLQDLSAPPAHRLTIAAHLVRHLSDDPMLPAELLPPDWSGDLLRAAYADYQGELRALAGDS